MRNLSESAEDVNLRKGVYDGVEEEGKNSYLNYRHCIIEFSRLFIL